MTLVKLHITFCCIYCNLKWQIICLLILNFERSTARWLQQSSYDEQHINYVDNKNSHVSSVRIGYRIHISSNQKKFNNVCIQLYLNTVYTYSIGLINYCRLSQCDICIIFLSDFHNPFHHPIKYTLVLIKLYKIAGNSTSHLEQLIHKLSLKLIHSCRLLENCTQVHNFQIFLSYTQFNISNLQ